LNREPKENRSETPHVGILKVLKAVHYEKVSETIPVKVQLSVKKYLKQVAKEEGVSAWIREAIIMRLQKEAQ